MNATQKTIPVTSTARLKLAFGAFLILPVLLPAATQYGSGSFTWDNGATAGWSSNPGGPYTSVWTAGNDAVLEGAAGTINLVNPTVHNLDFTAPGYVFTDASTLTLSGPTPTVALTVGPETKLPDDSVVTFGNGTAAVLDGNAGLSLAGNGVLTLNSSVTSTLTGGLNLNGPTLSLVFTNLTTPTDLINNGNALNFGGGRLTVTGNPSAATSQTFAGTTVGMGGGTVLVNPNNGTDTTVALGSLDASAPGSVFLVGMPAGAGSGTANITTTTSTNSVGNIYGGRVVFTPDGGTTADWATTTSGSSPYALSAYSDYTDLPLAGTLDTQNDRLQVNGVTTTLTGAHTHNSLKVETTGSSANTVQMDDVLTLDSGGLLIQGNQRVQFKGGSITAGADSGYEVIVNDYEIPGPGNIIFSGITDNGTNAVSFTKAGPGRVFINTAVSTYTGNTTVAGGFLGLNSSGVVIKSPVIYVRSGGQLFANNTGAQMTNTFNIAGYGPSQGNAQFGAIRMFKAVKLTGPVVLAGDSRIGCYSGETPEISGPISGGYGVDFYGAVAGSGAQDVFTLSNPNNDFSGNPTISCVTYGGGTASGSTILRLGASEVLPNGPGMGELGFLGSDADHVSVLDLNGMTETINGLFAPTPEAAAIENTGGSTTGTLIIGDADTSSTFSGTIMDNSGSGGTVAITKIGAGTLTLSGTNTYSGDTTISGGTLALGAGGSIENSVIHIAGGATFDVSANTTFTLGGNAGLRGSGINGSPATINGGASIGLGSQLLYLDFNPTSPSGDNTSPALTISQGNLTLNSPIIIYIGGSTPLGAGTYTIVSNLSGTISGSPTLLITSGPGPDGDGLESGTVGTLDLSTPGQLNLIVASSPNHVTLTRTVGGSPSALGATLTFEATLSPAAADGTTVNFFTNGVLWATATTVGGVADYTTSTLPYSGGMTYSIIASAAGYSPGGLAGGQQVTYDSWTNPLGGLWDTAGNWLDNLIADGTGNTADFSAIDVTNNVTVSLNGPRTIGIMIFGDASPATAGGWTVDNNGNAGNTLTLDGPAPTISVGDLGGSNVTISAVISGFANLNKSGPGTLVLSGANTFSANLVVNDGTLRITGGAAIPDSSQVVLTDTGVFDVAASETVAGLSASGSATNTELQLDSGTVLTITGSSGFGGRITGQGNVTFSGPNTGTFTLNNTNSTFSGITTVTSGRIQLLGGDTLSPNTTVVVVGTGSLSDGQLFVNSGNTVVNNNCTISGIGYPDSSGYNSIGAIRLQNGCVLGGTITLAADARIGLVNSSSAGVSGRITGGSGIDFYAADNANTVAAVFTVSNPGNDYSGNTSIDNVNYGTSVRTSCSTTVKLGASEVLPNGAGKGSLVFNGTDADHQTILDLNGFSETINGISDASGAGAVIMNASPGTSILAVGDADASSYFDGNVTDGGEGSGTYLALTKIGGGTLTLSANNYHGNTTVNGGTLTLAQPTLSTNSTVTITNGAVLQLAFGSGETNIVAGLVLNGTNQPAGLYDSSTPGGYLAGSGKLLVVPSTINPNPPVLQVSYAGGTMNLAWPTNQGWILQSNSVGLDATNAWFNFPANGSVDVTNVVITPDPAETNVFFRLLKP